MDLIHRRVSRILMFSSAHTLFPKGNHTGFLAFPLDTTRSNIITEAECLVVERYRCSSATSPNVTTRSFCMLMTWSTLKILSSGKVTMAPKVPLRWYRIFFARSIITFLTSFVNRNWVFSSNPTSGG
uniref:Uncharacterized protein n=1 Tax=Lepeophtheirus salmonis TaxID=72036 RepID=A0A0K2U7X4_LEPSM